MEYQLVDMGIDNPGCFQGFGVSGTGFSDCAYGIGSIPQEALDDCLDLVAEMGIDTDELETRIIADYGPAPDEPVAPDGMYYHVGIRWNKRVEQ